MLSKGYQRYKRDYITNANNERLFRVTKIPTVFFIKMYVDRVNSLEKTLMLERLGEVGKWDERG